MERAGLKAGFNPVYGVIPGTFPDELATEDFIKGDGYFILRNPLIAETMYLSADIKKWASGLKRIYDECSAVGAKVDFKRVKTGFVVFFHRPKWEEGKGPEIALSLNMSIAGIEKIIRSLKKQKRSRRIGPDKGGHWEISG